MADLIDRQAAIKLLRGECVEKYPHSFCSGLLVAADEIRKLTAIDAVEVVRCRDCARRGDPAECPMCFFIEGDWADYTRDGGYCDRGERREENAKET